MENTRNYTILWVAVLALLGVASYGEVAFGNPYAETATEGAQQTPSSYGFDQTDYSGTEENKPWWVPEKPYEIWPRKKLVERAAEFKEFQSQLDEETADPEEVEGVARELKRIEIMLSRTWGTHRDR